MSKIDKEIQSLQGLPSNQFLQRFDGHRWRIFDIDSGKVIVTACGQELLQNGRLLRAALGDYKTAVRFGRGNGIRTWFRSGANSDVYSLGNLPIVVKEASTSHSVWSALDRMDHLFWICQSFMPAHIRVAKHYGAIFSANLRRQYLIVEKINAGLTVQDVADGNHDESVTKQVGKIGGPSVVVNEYCRIKKQLDITIDAHRASGVDLPNNLLPDWEKNNVVVDLTQPTPYMPFTLCIIDQ